MNETFISENDLYLFNEGTHNQLYRRLGAHVGTMDGQEGTHFAVWAPNARSVSVFGDFNDWRPGAVELQAVGVSGIWAGFVPGVGPGATYKYHIISQHHGYRVEKADPFGFLHEVPPRTASIVTSLDYEWDDERWMEQRRDRNALGAAISIYEVHLGSWARAPGDNNRWLTYSEMAPRLARYAKEMNYTHVELMPIAEHALDEPRGCRRIDERAWRNRH